MTNSPLPQNMPFQNSIAIKMYLLEDIPCHGKDSQVQALASLHGNKGQSRSMPNLTVFEEHTMSCRAKVNCALSGSVAMAQAIISILQKYAL